MQLVEALALERRGSRPLIRVTAPRPSDDVELPGPALEDLEDLPSPWAPVPYSNRTVAAAWVSLACVAVLAVWSVPWTF